MGIFNFAYLLLTKQFSQALNFNSLILAIPQENVLDADILTRRTGKLNLILSVQHVVSLPMLTLTRLWSFAVGLSSTSHTQEFELSLRYLQTPSFSYGVVDNVSPSCDTPLD